MHHTGRILTERSIDFQRHGDTMSSISVKKAHSHHNPRVFFCSHMFTWQDHQSFAKHPALACRRDSKTRATTPL